MLIAPNTSAGRLWNILQRTRDEGPSDPSMVPIRQVWAKVFDVDEADRTRILQIHGGIINLVGEVEADVQRRFSTKAQLYLGPVKDLVNCFLEVSPTTEWFKIKVHLTDTTMSSLALIADSLETVEAETQIGEIELQNLLDEVDSLLRAIIESSINADLKITLVRSLEELRLAIINYKISGSSGIHRASERTVGSIVLSKEHIQTDEDSATVKDVIAVIDVVLELVGWSLKVYNVLAPTCGWPSLPPPEDE